MSDKKKEEKENSRIFKAPPLPRSCEKKEKKEKEIKRLKQMLPKIRRLNRELIKKALKEGKFVRGRSISLKYSVFPIRPTSFGLIVSSKTGKKAVFRNRIKRKGWAVISKLLPKIKKDRLVLIFFGRGSAEMDFSEMEKEISRLFREAGLLIS